jgi:hypothetical protein
MRLVYVKLPEGTLESKHLSGVSGFAWSLRLIRRHCSLVDEPLTVTVDLLLPRV